MGGWVKNEVANKGLQNSYDIVRYALEMNVNGVTCVCRRFHVKKHLKFVNWLNS